MSKNAVTTQQPSFNVNNMDLYQDLHAHPGDEKRSQNHQLECYAGHCEANRPCHRSCHKERLRRFLVPVVATLLGIAALFALSCFFDFSEIMSMGTEGLVKRATGDTAGNGNNAFVNKKYYLIVIFIGLVIVLILGICLSVWCCKGACPALNSCFVFIDHPLM
ncbi:hypothetical protein V5O48_009637 [Marasmius crinis-equi]|uniref:Uncharacterized protein n=1 Tax=Marasmius crinis-equi TaxID=585013 RepID=A0ABR3FAI0_9AGAR